MHTMKSLSRGVLAGSLLALAVAATVVGYSGQVAATVLVTGPAGAQTCGTPLTISATIQDAQGALISGQPVTWTFGSGNLSGDKILTATSTTNANGVATTRIQLSCSSHSVTVLATADEIQGSVVVRTSGEGLPRTDIAQSETSTPAILLAALAVLLGSGLMLRRFAVARR